MLGGLDAVKHLIRGYRVHELIVSSGRTVPERLRPGRAFRSSAPPPGQPGRQWQQPVQPRWIHREATDSHRLHRTGAVQWVIGQSSKA